MDIEDIINEVTKHHQTIKDVRSGAINKPWVVLFNEHYKIEDRTNEIGMAMISKQLVAYRKSSYIDGTSSEKIYNKHPINAYGTLYKIMKSYQK